MSDEEGLLWDVMENPEDDLPRLILADWLDDHGQHDRAELARAHVELARHSPKHAEVDAQFAVSSSLHDVPPNLGHLRRRMEEAGRHLFRPAQMVFRTCTLRRGYLDHAVLRFPHWERFAPLFWSNPVRNLWLTQVRERVGELLDSGILNRTLVVGLGEMTTDDLGRLADGPPLPRIRFLCLHQQRMEDVYRLLSSGALPPVRAIELSEVSTPTERGVVPGGFVFRGKSHGPLGPTIRDLALQPFLAGVHRLRLTCTAWRFGVIDALAGSPQLANLRELGLPNGYLDDNRLLMLLQAPWLSGLRSLDLRNNLITGAGAAMLASSDELAGLESLALAGNRITHGGWRRLEERFGDRLVGRAEINRAYAEGREPFRNPV